MKTQMLEILIAADDHRVLSASSDAWLLVDNSAFQPFEKFLTGDSQEAFSACFAREEGSWVPVRFIALPDKPCLLRLERVPGQEGPASDLFRVVIVRADLVIPEFQALLEEKNALEAMLSLSDDLYFIYDPETDGVTLMNATESCYSEGSRPLETFLEEMKQLCDKEELPQLEAFAGSLRKGMPRFQMRVACNVFNRDPAIPSTILKGFISAAEGGHRRTVGLIHAQHARGAGDVAMAFDPLTGLYNKEHITRMAMSRVDQLHAEGTTIAIVDVDYFKHVNDTYGHLYGDQVLQQTAEIMKSVVGNQGVIGRIGGDEFFILFYHTEVEELRAYLRSIKSLMNATFPGRGALPGTAITASMGAAVYPRDASNYSDLFMMADYCLYLAKEKGRNRYIHYTPEKHPPLEEIRKIQTGGDRNLVNGRDDLPLGDVITQLQFLVRYSETVPPIRPVLTEFAERFRIPLVMLWAGKHPARLLVSAGEQAEETKAAEEAVGKMLEGPIPPSPQPVFHGISIYNRVPRLSDDFAEVRESLLAHQVQSLMISPFTARDGAEAFLVFASLHRGVFWNEQHLPYYRLFVDTLSQYEL